MKIHNLSGLFDTEQVLEKLTKLGDPLVLIAQYVNFEIFREVILKFANRKENRTQP